MGFGRRSLWSRGSFPEDYERVDTRRLEVEFPVAISYKGKGKGKGNPFGEGTVWNIPR